MSTLDAPSPNFLCAVDLTHPEDARAILAEADRQAKLHDAHLSVMTVLPDYGSSFVGSFFKDGTLKEAIAKANEALHQMVDEVLPGHGHVQCITAIGSAYEQILEAAQKINAALIVVGAHKPNFSERVIGPNAARVARHAETSVLVVRL